MPLIAYNAGTGEEVESFSAAPETWMAWRRLPIGSFQVGKDRVPAVLKRSSRGLQFFACAPGHGGTTEPESIEHQLAKIALVQGLRAAGYQARVERPGRSPLGEEWVADVLAEANGRLIAFEVQLSQQHWDQYRQRTQRYLASGVKCLWLVRSKHCDALRYACMRHHVANGLSHNEAMNQGMDDMPWVHLEVSRSGESQFACSIAVKPSVQPSPVLRISPEEFAVGVVEGRMRFKQFHRIWTDWLWQVPQPQVDAPQLSFIPAAPEPTGLIF
ncbi:competence protein CoiA family protein [Piscinibacter gummiphilus]|uniref:Competence protein CoiA family protein n=1 Tax=Piscinibacter gummiphilus TaxID=946333 RepID=A0ABZ0D763_9BURK|nr:competence protein CoiA family protein [Piscinibacter gummiphilus]WOB11205.1 competence protein CoiA family protein [Piscinibacter gummiphilus]